MKKCMNCGYTTMNDTERFCTKCGAQLQLIKMAAPQQNVNAQGQPQQNMGNANVQRQPQQNMGNPNMQRQPQQNMGNANAQRQPQQNMGNANAQGQPQQNMGNVNMQGQPQQNMGNVNMQGQPQQNVNPNGQIINRENLNAAVDAKLNAVKAGVSKAAQKAGVSADDVKIKAEKAKAKAEEASKKLPFEVNKKRIIAAVAAVFIVFVLAFALTGNKRACKKTVNNMFEQLDTKIINTLNSSLQESLEVDQDTLESIGVAEFMDAFNDPFSYKIRKVKIDGDYAKVELKITNRVNGHDIVDELREAFDGNPVKTITSQLENGNTKGMVKEISKKIKKYRSAGTKTTYDGVVRLQKKYGEWMVTSVNKDVLRGYYAQEKGSSVSSSEISDIIGEVKENDY